MNYVFSVDQSELVKKTAAELKKIKEIKPPEWAIFVRTGVHKERPPVEKDWWYMRVASILKLLNRYSPLGTAKIRTKYGGRKNRGFKPDHFYKGSGSIARKILQQLDAAELTKKEEEKGRKRRGRSITPKGKSLLNKVALGILGKKPVGKKKVKIVVTEDKKEKVKKKPKKEVKKEIRKEEQKTTATDTKVADMVKKTKEKMTGEGEKKAKEIIKEINK